jgi:hypothetical protein
MTSKINGNEHLTVEITRTRLRCGDLWLLVWTAFVIILCSSSFGEDTKAAQAPCACQFASVFKAEGWTVPGVEGATLKSPRAEYNVGKMKKGVYVTTMKPGDKPSTVTWLHCSSDLPGVTQIQTIEIEALELRKFDVNGTVFAYGVTAGWMGREDKTGKFVRLGMADDKLFYDIDGSGKFKLMKNADYPFNIEIPSWVSTKSAAYPEPKTY